MMYCETAKLYFLSRRSDVRVFPTQAAKPKAAPDTNATSS
jgi:hypothetical protein